MKLGMTWVSQGVLQTPKILSAPTISSQAKRTRAMASGFQALRYLRCPARSNKLRARKPAMMLRNTAVSVAMPYTQSYGVNIMRLFFYYVGAHSIFKGFERLILGRKDFIP